MSKPLKLFLQPAYTQFFITLFISLIFLYASATHATTNNSVVGKNQQRQQIAKLTSELTRLLASYRKTDATEQALLEAELLALANERQFLLQETVNDDPGALLKYALPARVQAQFPALVQEKFEQWVHAQGKFEIYFEDHERHENSRLRFYLKQADRRFSLSVVGDKLPVQTSGHNVRVQGVLVSKDGKPVIATNDEQIMLAAGGNGDPVTSNSTAELSNTIGEQRTAVFLINFQDDPANKPWTLDHTNNRFFTEISQYFLETSYQQTWLSGDVFGWYTAAINSSECNPQAIANAAHDAASAQNIDLTQYARYIYVFPKNACSFAGLAYLGGSPSEAWINGDINGGVPAHEIGHNFGLFHSHGLNCQGDVTDTNCIEITYGDKLDTMSSNQGHFNAFQKERLGWLNHNQSPPLVTVEQTGSYAIENYETTTVNAKALKVFRDIDPASGQNRWYYIEFRQAIGQDMFMLADPYLDEENITNGVVIHLGTENKGDSSYLLDMTPESTNLTFNIADLLDPALVAGSTYSGSGGGLTITTEYTDSQAATVYVSFDGPSPSPCVHSNPLVVVSPTESQWVSAATQVDFTLSVTNQDSSDCSSATFAIEAIVPTGWNVNNNQLTLAPGQTGTVAISVTSANDAIDDFYDIILTATNSENSDYSTSAMATYVVYTGSINSAPDAVNDNVSMTNVEPIVINVMSNDFDPDADAFYISSVGSAAKGDVLVNADGMVIYTPAKRFKDSDSFTYTISDGQASDSATVAITLQSSTSDGGDGTKGGGKGGGKPSK